MGLAAQVVPCSLFNSERSFPAPHALDPTNIVLQRYYIATSSAGRAHAPILQLGTLR